MSLFYRFAYLAGVTPWEAAASHAPAARHIATIFDREGWERPDPPGRALDLGCGTGFWTVDLARRGWEVTGVDLVPRALRKARRRAAAAGVDARFLEADMTRPPAAEIGGPFDFIWDFGAIHGFDEAGRMAAGRFVTALAAPDATFAMLAWTPGRRGPLPRGASREEIEAAFPDWRVETVEAFDVSGLPPPLRTVDPYVYRLRRTA